MITVIQEFTAIRDHIAEILKASGYRNDYIANKLGMSRQNFAMKKQRASFSPEELQKIVELVTEPNEDAEDAIMLEIMRSRKNDEKLSYDEYKKEINSWK